jgi:hypothetical protein
MEKMQLGSPASPVQSGYLPNFLMGSETPRSFGEKIRKRKAKKNHFKNIEFFKNISS